MKIMVDKKKLKFFHLLESVVFESWNHFFSHENFKSAKKMINILLNQITLGFTFTNNKTTNTIFNCGS